MDKLISALGIDVKVLIAQLINFAILMGVIYYFGIRPMLKFLDERSHKIEKGVRDAESASRKVLELENKEKEILREAKKEAMTLIEQAKLSGDEKRSKIVAKAKEEVAAIIMQEKDKIRAEKAEIVKEIKSEIGDLVIVALKKVLSEGFDEKRDTKLVETLSKQLRK